MNTLLPSEVQRVRHVRSPRELGAVIDDVEARLGRPLTVADCDEVTDARLGRPVIQVPRTATFERDLPGWGGAASLYRLSPGLETDTGRVVEYVVLAIRERHAISRQHVSPATESGFVLCQERVQQPIGTTCPREALRSLGYDVVEQAEGAVA